MKACGRMLFTVWLAYKCKSYQLCSKCCVSDKPPRTPIPIPWSNKKWFYNAVCEFQIIPWWAWVLTNYVLPWHLKGMLFTYFRCLFLIIHLTDFETGSFLSLILAMDSYRPTIVTMTGVPELNNTCVNIRWNEPAGQSMLNVSYQVSQIYNLCLQWLHHTKRLF